MFVSISFEIFYIFFNVSNSIRVKIKIVQHVEHHIFVFKIFEIVQAQSIQMLSDIVRDSRND